MQEQMAVCEFDKCDFLECSLREVSEGQFWDDFYYIDETNNIDRERGVIILYIDLAEGDMEYMYSPIEYYDDINKMKEWETTTIDHMLHDPTKIYLQRSYWYLAKYNCQLVKRDPHWIRQYYPILKKFWDEIVHYREVGIDSLIKSQKKEEEEVIEEEEPDEPINVPNKKKSICLL
jgi:hypothetical protein